MSLHAFVAMPYKTKEGINFDKVYQKLICPALHSEGLQVFRADEEQSSGDIRKDMFQELLLADIVIADLSIDNPNVWYELGVRHALRSTGIIHIKCKRKNVPFDIYSDRTLTYSIGTNGEPDINYLEQEKRKLAEFVKNTQKKMRYEKTSPIYNLLNNLEEPNWRALRTKNFQKYHKELEDHIRYARINHKPANILVYSEEASNQALKLEIYRIAANALRDMGQFEFSLEQVNKALEIDPEDIESLRMKGFLLGRLGETEKAIIHLNRMIEKNPNDAESHALFGRIEKEAWIASWRNKNKTPDEMFKDAADEEDLLREAIITYKKGFIIDSGHYYSGINALTLKHLLFHLTQVDNEEERKELRGGVRWAIKCALEKNSKDYWANVSLADLEILTSDHRTVLKKYKWAIKNSNQKLFNLDSTKQQLLILKDLKFRPELVDSVLDLFNKVLDQLKPPQMPKEPKKVFLFSGHMIDHPEREGRRFPKEKEQNAAQKIKQALDEMMPEPGDLALCGGACGGDILFAEHCLDLGLNLEIRLPLEEPLFIKDSVRFAGEEWVNRYLEIKNHENTSVIIMPDELSPLPDKVNPYSRNNLWQLFTALSWGLDKINFICLWNQQTGDGPGGTEHMYNTVSQYSGKVKIIDTNDL